MCRKAFAKKAPVFSGEKEWMERNDKELENEEMRRKAGKGEKCGMTLRSRSFPACRREGS